MTEEEELAAFAAFWDRMNRHACWVVPLTCPEAWVLMSACQYMSRSPHIGEELRACYVRLGHELQHAFDWDAYGRDQAARGWDWTQDVPAGRSASHAGRA